MNRGNPIEEAKRQLFPKERIGEWIEIDRAGREWEELYRRRWQHDNVVRSTHGVNCTGSCSWKIYVKDGLVVWEHQATDYPSNSPELPDYEPRGCPRGASFSWYLYSPLRIKHPYVRSALLRAWREELSRTNDPVLAWEKIVESEHGRAYKFARGKGGFVRASWDEALELISAALIYTIRKYGPDRIFGFTPIPAMSMVSYSSGSRFLELIGGVMLSFYDWYADLPPASPQVWGEQTDVPESADWLNSLFIIVWGTNLAMTRTPDAHFLSEARYRGAKVAVITPDYTDVTKFADIWLSPRPGTDGAMAMAMLHVILNEFYMKKSTPYFIDYVKKFTDLPFLVVLERENGQYRTGRFLRASDIGINTENAEWKTVVLNSEGGELSVPNGSIGFRWGKEKKWNLRMEDSLTGKKIDPYLTLLGNHDEIVQVSFPVLGKEAIRGVPARKIRASGGEFLVTTVFDLLVAHAGVSRGLPGDYPESYDDPKPFTPAWQEEITGVSRKAIQQLAIEFAETAEKTKGSSMVIIGPGVNHWFHSDLTYRAIISMLILLGTVGKRGGGLAHYVGQEKVRPIDSWSLLAFALDWQRPPRQQNTTSWMYIHSDQYRFEDLSAKTLSPRARYEHPGDYIVEAVKRGWLPFYPQFTENPIELYKKLSNEGKLKDEEIRKIVAEMIDKGELKFSVEDPDHPASFPRILFIWRANLLASSGKGHEYILKHLVGAESSLSAKESDVRPNLIAMREPIPEGKLDLIITLDFRMSTSAIYSDIILPAATWYEKNDLSTTDLHPFIHPFNQAVPPAWESRSDWDIFVSLSKKFTELACSRLGKVKEIVLVSQLHDTPGELSGEGSKPSISIVERDYCDVHHRMTSLGPLASKSIGAKGISWSSEEEYSELVLINGADDHGHPLIDNDRKAAEAILHLSSVTNGRASLKAFRALSEATGITFDDMEIDASRRTSFTDLASQPRRVLTSPIWSGKEKGTYSPFTLNVENSVPFRTLTGRQHIYIDHPLFIEFEEQLPTYKPPVSFAPFQKGEGEGKIGLVLRYLTPHGKWQIHSTFMDNLFMLTLFRGGPVIWISRHDAEALGVKDNEWVEASNRNGSIVARAVVSDRIPKGVAIMYHAQERTISAGKDPSGTHNSPTRTRIKPTLLAGGYAQISWAFNYYGPTGTQRDELILLRKVGEQK
ncbi:MAG: nitrate reductase subunit alpha [Fervidicoccaceae archaeon]